MKITLIILGVFITLESINAVRLFNGVQHNIIYRIFTSFQHVVTGTSGFIMTWYASLGIGDWQHLIFGLSLTAFILSEAVYRWVNTLRELYPFYYYWITSRCNFLSRRKTD